MTTHPRVFLGLGSNLGDRQAAIERALRLLEARGFASVRDAVGFAHLSEPERLERRAVPA